MKATGIVRRIDDLGRVVIPKEIRRTLRIREGDPLEIYTEKDGGVIFRKYSPMGDLQDFAAQICESIGKNTGRIAAVADRDSIIALSGAPRRELVDRRNSADLENLMEQRKSYRYSPGNVKLRAVEGSEKYYLGAAAPIVAQGDLMGCVMLLMDEEETPAGRGGPEAGADGGRLSGQTNGGIIPKTRGAFRLCGTLPVHLHRLCSRQGGLYHGP